jgi:hypothetical protein
VAKCAIPKGTLSSTDSPYAITASYSGDSNFEASSANGTATVQAPPAG